jgi:hypothetical protein
MGDLRNEDKPHVKAEKRLLNRLLSGEMEVRDG